MTTDTINRHTPYHTCNSRRSWWERLWRDDVCIWRETKREMLRTSREAVLDWPAPVHYITLRHEAISETCVRCGNTRIREEEHTGPLS